MQLGNELFQDDSLTFLIWYNEASASPPRGRDRLFANLDVIGDLSRFHGVTSVGVAYVFIVLLTVLIV